MNENITIQKIQAKKGKLIAGIIIVGICLILEFLAYSGMKKEYKDATNLVNAKDSSKYSYIDVDLMTDYFASYEDDDSKGYAYFTFDEKYMYISMINDSNLKKLETILEYAYSGDEGAAKPDKVRIYGYSKEISSELKRIAISSYNSMFETDFLTNDNFSEYFGFYYLDTTSGPKDTFAGESIFIGIIFIFGMIMIIKYFSNYKKSKEILEKYSFDIDNINSELSSSDTLYIKEANIYLTRNYIVSTLNGLEIYKYSDLRWIYPHENRYNGAVTNKSIMAITNDSKSHIIGQIKVNKKNLIKFDELYDMMMNKTPDIMHGYTDENVKKNKELNNK